MGRENAEFYFNSEFEIGKEFGQRKQGLSQDWANHFK